MGDFLEKAKKLGNLAVNHIQSEHNNKLIQSTTYQSIYLYTTFSILFLRKDF